jgi:DNA (cytosine-5)-methyltransferase 1
MDSAKTITHVSLCAGYGGIDLGLKRAIPNLRTIAFSEIEGFACANLVAKMEAGLLDAAPIWTNLKTFPWGGGFCGKVDILSGGYPCQPFSAAGKRLGSNDPRHLWPFIANGIKLMQPKLCFFENVEGHISLGLRAVIEELGSIGYKTTWGIFSAREVGAPHQRKRVFILAERSGERSARRFSRQINWQEGIAAVADNGGDVAWPSRPSEPQHEWEPPRVVANSASQRTNNGQQLCGEECRQGGALPCESDESGEGVGNPNGINWSASASRRLNDAEARPASKTVGDPKSGMPRESSAWDWRESIRGASEAGQLGDSNSWRQSPSIDTRSSGETISGGESNIEQTECREAEPSLGRDSDGSASGMDHAELCISGDNRTDELRLLGNGVVPATATKAFLTLIKQLDE